MKKIIAALLAVVMIMTVAFAFASCSSKKYTDKEVTIPVTDENGNIAQKTEDNIGPYELHDFFLYNFVRFGFEKNKTKRLALKAFDGKYDERMISKWLAVFTKRFFISQFKRSCIPDSPKVGSVSLSPRGDWRMPSDASFNAFI